MLVGTSSPVVLWTLMKKLFWTKRERSQPDTKPTTQYWVTTEEWGYGYKVTSKSVTLVTFVRIKIQLIEKTSTSGSKYYKYKTWWNVPTHKPEILSSLALASSRRQKAKNLLPPHPKYARFAPNSMNRIVKSWTSDRLWKLLLQRWLSKTPLSASTSLFLTPS